MFFVEREPGNVVVYESANDLSKAIREAVLGPNARIFHRLSSQWLSITKHPAYRQANTPAESEALPALGRRHWTFFPGLTTHAKPVEPSSARTNRRPKKTKEASPEVPSAEARSERWPDSIREIFARFFSVGPVGTPAGD